MWSSKWTVKAIVLQITMIMCFVLCPIIVRAEETIIDKSKQNTISSVEQLDGIWEYQFLDGNKVYLDRYIGNDKNVVIPSIPNCTVYIFPNDQFIPKDTKGVVEDGVKGGSNFISWLFKDVTGLETADISGLDTSDIEYMDGLFYGCSSLRYIDMRGIDTSKVKSMSYLFEGCTSLETLLWDIDLSSTELNNFTQMFSNCSSLQSINLSPLKNAKPLKVDGMFSGCSSLKSIDLSPLDVSQTISMYRMFGGCSSLTNIDLRGLDTSKVTNMSQMFQGCSSLLSVNMEGVDTSMVKTMYRMFYECSSLEAFDFSVIDISSVTDLEGMFSYCHALEAIDLSVADTSNVTTMFQICMECTSLKTAKVGNHNTSNVKQMGEMFSRCSNLETVDFSGFNNTRDTEGLVTCFSLCYNIRYLNCSGLQYCHTLSLHGMDSLETFFTPKTIDIAIELPRKYWSNDLGLCTKVPVELNESTELRTIESMGLEWDIEKGPDNDSVYLGKYIGDATDVVIPSKLQVGNKQLSTYLGVDESNIGQAMFPKTVESITVEEGVLLASDISYVFYGIEALKSINLGNLDSTNVKSMTFMFHGCNNLKELDLSSFDVSNVITKNNEDIDILPWNADNLLIFKTPKNTGNNSIYLPRVYLDKEGNRYELNGKLRHLNQSIELAGEFSLDIAWKNSVNLCNNTITLTVYNGDEKEITIPATFRDGDRIYSTIIGDNYGVFPPNTKKIHFEKGIRPKSKISNLFKGNSELEEVDLRGLDISDVDDMSELFSGCSKLRIVNMEGMKNSKVRSTEAMFLGCEMLESIDLGGFDMSNCYNMINMFSGCRSLVSLDLRHFEIEEYWVDTANMFSGCCSLEELDISGMDLSIPAEDDDENRAGTFSLIGCNHLQRIVTPKKMGDTAIQLPGLFTSEEDGKKYRYIPADINKSMILSRPKSDIIDDETEDCSGRDPKLISEEENVENDIHYYDAYMVKGQTYVFPANYGDIDASSSKKDQAIAWKTSDKKTASISGKNKVKAVNSTGSKSTVQIYDGATYASSEYVYRLHIVSPMLVEYGKTTQVKSIKLTVGDNHNLALTGLTDYEDKYNVTWLSSNREIASVDNGTVSAAMKGSTKITAYVGGKAYTCNVKVVDTRTIPKTIEDEVSITLSPLQTVSLKFANKLFKAKNLEWISEDGTLKPYNKNNAVAASTDKVSYFQNEVVRVTPSGKVTAVGVGSTTISATDQNGITQTVTITVPSPVTQTLSLNVNKTRQIKLYNVKADKAIWNSSDSKVTGNIVKGKIQGVRYGTAEATCTYDPYNTGKPIEYKITVQVENPKLDTTESAKWSKVNAAKTSGTLTLKVGDKYKVSLTDVYQDVVFTSNKPTVAFVDEAGNISVRDAGKAKLTAKVNGTSITINIVATK